MKTKNYGDPDFHAAIDQFPVFNFSNENLPEIRRQFQGDGKVSPDLKGVVLREVLIPTGDPARSLRVFTYTPEDADKLKPAILHMHGGGFVMGTSVMNDARNKALSKELGVVIVSVDYRVAPEFPYPAAVEDCYTALKWVADGAAGLGIDKSRIGVYGTSAGGGLAASLAILARDRGEVRIAHQFLIYPMLDERVPEPVGANQFAGDFVWTRDYNTFGWASYLGAKFGTNELAPYAAASRLESAGGLPPAFIAVGALDLLIDEDMLYAHKLLKGGIDTELHVYPAVTHMFDKINPRAAVSEQFNQDFKRAVRNAFF